MADSIKIKSHNGAEKANHYQVPSCENFLSMVAGSKSAERGHSGDVRYGLEPSG